MNKTAIDWCDMTWNPVTGCLHGCEYCYARKIAERFGLAFAPKLGDPGMEGACKYDSPEGMDTMLQLENPYVKNGRMQPFPMAFLPTFHKYRLDEPAKLKKPQKIFVCSMADLFGEWVPDEWIRKVFEACEAAPQHKYLFLTKNGSRYEQLGLLPHNDNFWYGTTRTGVNRKLECGAADHGKKFLSLEPLLAPLDTGTLNAIELWDWVIVGQQTGPGAKPLKPEWVQLIIDQCRAAGVPVFVKSPLYKQFPIQEWPNELV